MLKKIYSASAGTGKTEIIIKTFFGIENINKSIDEYIEHLKDENEISKFIKKLNELKTTVFISFSNAAADEIKSRLWKSINKILEKQRSLINNKNNIVKQEDILPTINVFTFHTFCLRVIKILRHIFYLPVDVDFLPQLPSEQETTLWAICVEEYFNFITDKEILKFFQLVNIENCKNFLKRHGFLVYALNQLGYLSIRNLQQQNLNNEIHNWIDLKEKIEEIEENGGKGIEEVNQNELSQQLSQYFGFLNDTGKKILLEILEDVYKRYLKKIYNEGLIDYDTALFLVTKKIKELDVKDFFERLKNSGWEIKEIFVDEAQDNDVIQNDFVLRICNNNEYDLNIYIVGDHKQSIYQWRDAYPEEFQKLVNEINENVKDKCVSLRTTWRIKNKNTLDYINNVFSSISKNYQFWDYNEQDKLELPNKISQQDNNTESQELIKMCSISSNYVFFPNAVLQSESNNKQYNIINDIFKPTDKCKKIGILVRSRSDLKPIKQIINELKDNVRYRIQESTTIIDLADDIDDFFPEYLLIRNLFLLFDKKIWLLPYFLCFTYPGRVILKKILSKENNSKIDSIENLLKKLLEKLYEIKEKYKYQKYIPAIYDIIYDFNLWNIMTHNDLPQNRKYEIIRQINSFLGLIYLFEKNQFLSQKNIDSYLETPILPYEWGTLPDSPQDKPIIEVSTIHSAKGLTYDRVIVIADFFEDFLKTDVDFSQEKEKFEFLFNIKFNKLLTRSPKVEVNFFPYIIMKKTIRTKKHIIPDFIIDYYNEVKKKINIEKLNLLYVALTRTRQDIIMINRDKKKINQIINNIKQIFIHNSIDKPNKPNICEFLKVPNAYVNQQAVNKYMYKTIDLFSHSNIKLHYVISTVRDESKIVKTIDIEKKVGAWKNYQYIVVGKTLHEILRNFVKKKGDLDDIIKYLAKDDKEIIENIRKNSKTSFNKIETIRNVAVKIFAEVPVWSKEKNNEIYNIISGIVDCFYLDNGTLYLYEYKTLFAQNEQEKQQNEKNNLENYNAQVTKYKQMLSNAFGLNKHNNDNLIFFYYLDSNESSV